MHENCSRALAHTNMYTKVNEVKFNEGKHGGAVVSGVALQQEGPWFKTEQQVCMFSPGTLVPSHNPKDMQT